MMLDIQADCDATDLALWHRKSFEQTSLHLVHLLLGERIKHAEAVVEVRGEVAVDLPREAEGHTEHIMHVIRCRPMGQVAYRTRFLEMSDHSCYVEQAPGSMPWQCFEKCCDRGQIGLHASIGMSCTICFEIG